MYKERNESANNWILFKFSPLATSLGSTSLQLGKTLLTCSLLSLFFYQWLKLKRWVSLQIKEL